MRDGLAKAAFVVSVLVAGIAYGSLSGMYGWFPYPNLLEARAVVLDVTRHWRNDVGLQPTRHLVTARSPDRVEFRTVVTDDTVAGFTLIGGLTPGRETLQGATLYDADGQEVHQWVIDYEALDRDGEAEENVLLHGLLALEDGSIAVAFDNGNVIARIDACGNPRWVQQGRYHHVVTRDDDGAFWSWRDEALVQLDADSGEIMQTIDMRTDVVETLDLVGVLGIRTHPDADRLAYQEDPFHVNDVEPLTAALAPAFPDFEAGDLLVSMRELNLIAVMDPTTRQLRWWRHGPWFKQHDPDFQPNGRISVYDNRMGLGGSRIVVIDPATDEWEVVLEDGPQTPFYSWQRGTHQILANGDILVTEPQQGRVFQVDRYGRLRWEREIVFDETQNYIVTTAFHLPPDFFDDGVPTC